LEEVEGKTFKHGEKCYKFSHETRKCSSDARSVKY
jgi:hypothetical protein